MCYIANVVRNIFGGELMNIQKFTQKSIESVNKSSAIATEYGNQEVDQEHLLLALLTIDESLIAELIERWGFQEKTLQRM